MYKACGILLLLVLIVTRLCAQPVIRGKVVVASTGAPLSGSSVFISNTSRGTTTDNDGNFELPDIPAGRHDLIISHVGYETNVYTFNNEELPLQLRVEMQIKVRELQNVVVEPFVEEGWDKWGNTFIQNFIGSVENADHCRIRNSKDIRFRYYKKTNRLKAYSDQALIIENRALGYIIRFQLEDFEVNFTDHLSLFTGYPLFEEITKARKGLAGRWKRNREKAYYGSMMHFMRSIYHNNLLQEGFEVRRMKRDPNAEKERVRKILRSTVTFGGHAAAPDADRAQSATRPGMSDSSEYYQRIMRQPDYTEVYSKDLLNADSLVAGVDGEFKIIYFPDYLYITYQKAAEEERYLEFFHENRKPFLQRSFITIMQDTQVAIDVNGNYYPSQQVFSGAYWGWSSKIANLLPLDYEP